MQHQLDTMSTGGTDSTRGRIFLFLRTLVWKTFPLSNFSGTSQLALQPIENDLRKRRVGPWIQKMFIMLAILGAWIVFSNSAHAATLYWVGGAGDSVTGSANDWSTTNPAACNDGGGNASAVPGSGDVATFDPDCDNNASITGAWSLQKLDMQSGYSGTITQSASTTITLDPGTSGDALAIAGGTLTDAGNASAVIDINDGNFNQSGGVYSHTGTSSSMTVEQSFTVSAGTYTNTGNTVTFDDNGVDASTVTCSETLSGFVGLNKVVINSSNTFTIASGCTVSLGASPTTRTDFGLWTNNGTILVDSGTWTMNGSSNSLANNGTITHSGNGWDINRFSLTNNSGGTITYAGTAITVGVSFTQNGTFDLSGKTITFDDASTPSATVTCSGSLGGTVVITKALINAANTFTIASGCSINLGANPTTRMDWGTLTNNGTITVASGTWTINGSNTTNPFTNNGTITHSGNGWDLNDISFTNSSGATVTYSGTAITMEKSFTQSGTFNLSGIAITFDDTSTTDDTTVTCSGTLGATVVITKDSDGDFINSSDCSISLGASPTTTIDADATTDFDNNGTITVASGTWTINATASFGAINNDGTITHSGNGWDINNASLTNSATGTSTYAGTAITIERSFTQSGTFNLSGITITFDDTGTSGDDDTTLTCSGSLGGTVVISKDTGGDFTNASGCSIDLGASPTSLMGGGFAGTYTNNGTMTIASGTWSIPGSVSTSSIFTNNGTITHSGNGWDINDTSLVNSSGATITYNGTTITMQRSFTQSGTFDLTGKTITFDDGGDDDSVVNCSGSLGGTVVITKSGRGDFTNGTGCIISLGANPTSTMGGGFGAAVFINNGTMTIESGTWTMTTATDNNTLTNNGTITHSGNGWDINNLNLTNSSGAVITYAGTTISIERGFTQSGTFDLSGKTLTFDGADDADDASVTCGSGVSLGSVTINKSHASGNTTLASDCTFTGNFTRTDGPLLVSGTRTLIVQGNVSMSTTDTFGSASLTLTLGGSGTQTLTQNAGTMATVFKVDKSGGSATLTTALTTGSTCNIVEGVFALAGFNFTCGSTFTVEDGGNFTLQGGETTVTSPTLNSGSIVTYNGTGTYASLKLGNGSYHHLVFNGAGSWVHTSTLDVNGDLTISDGTLNSNGQNITLAGDWSNSDTYTGGSNTVTLDGTNQEIFGATTFNNLTKIVSTARTLTFPAGAKQTITGATTLQGASGALLSLRSSSSGTQWQFDPQGTRNISFVDVKDSRNTNATSIVTAGNNITDSGNNTGWSFQPEAPSDFSGTALSSTSIRWQWTDNATDETGFRLLDGSDNTIATISSANTTSYTETGLTRGTSYTRRVVAFNNAGTSDASATAIVSTLTSSPTSPDLKSPADEATLVTLYPTFSFGRSVDDDDGISTYTLLINPGESTQESVTFNNPQAGATILVSSATITATEDTISVRITDSEWLEEGGTYTWKARATDTAGNSADSDIRTFKIEGSSSGPTSPQSPGTPLRPSGSAEQAPLATELETHSLTITEVIEKIARGEIPTRAPEALQLDELAKQARLRVEKQSENLFAFLQRFIPYDLLAQFDAALQRFVSETRATLLALVKQSAARIAALGGFGREQLLALNNLLHVRLAAVSHERERLTGEIQNQLSDVSEEQAARLAETLLTWQTQLANRVAPPDEATIARLREQIPELSGPDTDRLIALGKNGLTNSGILIADRREAALRDVRGLAGLVGRGIVVTQDTARAAHEVLITARNNRLMLARDNEALIDQAAAPVRLALQRSRTIALFAWDTFRGANDTPFKIADVTIEHLDEDSATISWTTNRLSTGKVNFGPSRAYGADGTGGEAHADELAHSHSVDISGLGANTRIYFEVVATDAQNNSTADAYYSFITP